jgi:hypothetical protein
MNEIPTVNKEITRGLKIPLKSSSFEGLIPDLDQRSSIANAYEIASQEIMICTISVLLVRMLRMLLICTEPF